MWIKLGLSAVLVAAIAGAGFWFNGVLNDNKIKAMTIDILAKQVAAANAERDTARKEARENVDKINGELRLANKLAEQAEADNEKLHRRLTHANAALETWKLSSAVAAAALAQPMPDSVLPRPETGPTTEIGRDPCQTSSASDGSDTGTCPRTIAEGLRLCNEVQTAFRQCNLRLELLRDWSAAQP